MTVVAACSETHVAEAAEASVWGEWSMWVAFNWSNPFWGPLTMFTGCGIFIFGFGGPRVTITWPIRT